MIFGSCDSNNNLNENNRKNKTVNRIHYIKYIVYNILCIQLFIRCLDNLFDLKNRFDVPQLSRMFYFVLQHAFTLIPNFGYFVSNDCATLITGS